MGIETDTEVTHPQLLMGKQTEITDNDLLLMNFSLQPSSGRRPKKFDAKNRALLGKKAWH
jgi:hypothetical protein